MPETQELAANTEAGGDGNQVVLVLVGLVGSGKSTFANALQEHRPHFRRCNQDELGNRRKVEELARTYLRRGDSVCIDRTNMDASQRETWIRIAHEIPGTVVWILEFDTPFEVCEERLRYRTGHPTIHSPEQGISILQRFHSQYQTPRPWEGYNCILKLCVEDQRPFGYSATDISNILTRLENSPNTTEPSVALRNSISSQSSLRGRHRGGYNNGYRSFYGYSYHNGNRNARAGSSRGFTEDISSSGLRTMQQETSETG